MGEIILTVAGLTLIILRLFQWARKMQADYSKQINEINAEHAELLKEHAKLEGRYEAARERCTSISKAAKYYRLNYLELKVKYEQLVNR